MPSLPSLVANFYPRPPRGGRHLRYWRPRRIQQISIHALREEGDPLGIGTISPIELISIHALREEGDRSRRTSRSRALYFYPRPPRGGRHGQHQGQRRRMDHFYPRPPRGGRRLRRHESRRTHGFLSTPSARRATFLKGAPTGASTISIHALREEGDSAPYIRMRELYHFYPRPPRGGRRRGVAQAVEDSQFLSTPSARRATSDFVGEHPGAGQFLSTPSARRATGARGSP